MEISDIEDALRLIEEGASRVQHSQTANTATAEPEAVALSDADITSILEDNGYTVPQQEVEHPLTSAPEGAREREGGGVNTVASEEPAATPSIEPVEETPAEEANPSEDFIPLNSPTLLMDDTTARFSGAEWYNEIKKARIIIAGVGGIGSNLCFQISRMTPEVIALYDPDTVEAVNMAGQLFGFEDVGVAKVTAIARMVKRYANIHQIFAIQEPFTSNTKAGDIMMCGFDSMAARKMFFTAWEKHVREKPESEKAKCLYLDGRLSMDTLQILCIRGDDTYNIRRYREEFLFPDREAAATVCSMKQTTYLACMIGSLMTNLFTNFVANTINPIIPYDLPFFTEYDAHNMLFRTEN